MSEGDVGLAVAIVAGGIEDKGVALCVAGGVAANEAIRKRLKVLAAEKEFRFVAPPPNLCTDNAAMIAWAGVERLLRGMTDGLDFAPRPRWPLGR